MEFPNYPSLDPSSRYSRKRNERYELSPGHVFDRVRQQCVQVILAGLREAEAHCVTWRFRLHVFVGQGTETRIERQGCLTQC